jgi:DNA-directed RNA polymerase subunit RPC12/RpoP
LTNFDTKYFKNENICTSQEKHKKDERLECQHCGHVYLRKDNLDAHVRTAHPDATGSDVALAPTCQLCSKTFSSPPNLNDHMRICHGILPWNVLPLTKDGQVPILPKVTS